MTAIESDDPLVLAVENEVDKLPASVKEYIRPLMDRVVAQMEDAPMPYRPEMDQWYISQLARRRRDSERRRSRSSRSRSKRKNAGRRRTGSRNRSRSRSRSRSLGRKRSTSRSRSRSRSSGKYQSGGGRYKYVHETPSVNSVAKPDPSQVLKWKRESILAILDSDIFGVMLAQAIGLPVLMRTIGHPSNVLWLKTEILRRFSFTSDGPNTITGSPSTALALSRPNSSFWRIVIRQLAFLEGVVFVSSVLAFILTRLGIAITNRLMPPTILEKIQRGDPLTDEEWRAYHDE